MLQENSFKPILIVQIHEFKFRRNFDDPRNLKIQWITDLSETL